MTGIAAKTLHEILTQQRNKKFIIQNGVQVPQNLDKIEATPVPIKTDNYLTFERNNKINMTANHLSSERFHRVR